MDPSELELARRRLAIETRLRRIDQELQRRQIAAAAATPQGWRVLITPTGAVIAAALLGLFGTAAAKFADYRVTRRQLETNVILKAGDVSANLSVEEQEIQRARNLLWFAEAEYISLPKKFIEQLQAASKLGKEETLGAPVIRPSQDVKTSDPPSFDIIGTRFTPAEFRKYVSTMEFIAWSPQFAVVHHTGTPTSAWHTVPGDIRMRNLAEFYRGQKGWSGGPHLIIDDEGIWVFNPLDKPGIHSATWNKVAWGIEMVGDYSHEPVNPKIFENTVEAIAILYSALGIDPATLRLHKDDPKTAKDCPGDNIKKDDLLRRINEILQAARASGSPR